MKQKSIVIEPIGRQEAASKGLIPHLMHILNNCHEYGIAGFYTEQKLTASLATGEILLINIMGTAEKIKTIGAIVIREENRLNETGTYYLAFTEETTHEQIVESLKVLSVFALMNKSLTKISIILPKQEPLENLEKLTAFLSDSRFKPEGVSLKALKNSDGFKDAWICSSSTNGRGVDSALLGLMPAENQEKEKTITVLKAEIKTLKKELEAKNTDLKITDETITALNKKIAGLEKDIREENERLIKARDQKAAITAVQNPEIQEVDLDEIKPPDTQSSSSEKNPAPETKPEKNILNSKERILQELINVSDGLTKRELKEKTDMTQSAIQQNVRTLAEDGMVTDEKIENRKDHKVKLKLPVEKILEMFPNLAKAIETSKQKKIEIVKNPATDQKTDPAAIEEKLLQEPTTKEKPEPSLEEKIIAILKEQKMPVELPRLTTQLNAGKPISLCYPYSAVDRVAENLKEKKIADTKREGPKNIKIIWLIGDEGKKGNSVDQKNKILTPYDTVYALLKGTSGKSVKNLRTEAEAKGVGKESFDAILRNMKKNNIAETTFKADEAENDMISLKK